MCPFVNGSLHLAKCFQNMWISSVLCSFLLPNTIPLSGYSSFYLRHPQLTSELFPLFGCVSVLVHIWTLTSVQFSSLLDGNIPENGIAVLCGTQPFEEHPGHFPKQPHHSTLLSAVPADSSLLALLLALVIFSVELILKGVKWSHRVFTSFPGVQGHPRSFSCLLYFVSLESYLLNLLLIL